MIPFLASNNPIHHILDKPVTGTESFTLFGKPGFTIHMASLFIVAFVTFIVLRYSAKRIAVGDSSEGTQRYLTKGRVAQLIEGHHNLHAGQRYQTRARQRYESISPLPLVRVLLYLDL